MTCPIECVQEQEHIKDDVKGIKTTLFGAEGSTGIVGRGDSFVKKTTLLVVVLALIGVFATVALWGMDDKFNVRKAIADNSKKSEVNYTEITNIKEAIIEIKQQNTALAMTQKVILENQVHAITEMHKIVRDAIKEAAK